MVVQQVLLTLWSNFLLSLPGLISAVITLIIGFIIGKIIGKIVNTILIRVKVDEYLEGEKPHFRLSHIFSVIASWIIYLIFIQQAAIFLGVASIIGFIETSLGFMYGLIEAALVMIIGYSLASYIKEKLITTKTVYSSAIGNMVFFLLVYLSIAMALPFVGIDATLVNWILLIIIASAGIGMAIALGWGLKDVVRDVGMSYSSSLKGRRIFSGKKKR